MHSCFCYTIAQCMFGHKQPSSCAKPADPWRLIHTFRLESILISPGHVLTYRGSALAAFYLVPDQDRRYTFRLVGVWCHVGRIALTGYQYHAHQNRSLVLPTLRRRRA